MLLLLAVHEVRTETVYSDARTAASRSLITSLKMYRSRLSVTWDDMGRPGKIWDSME